MNSSSIPESVWGHTDVLYPGLNTRKIPQEELPWELLTCAQKVRDSLWGFLFLHKKKLFQLGLGSVHHSVVFVVQNFPSKGSHRLNMSRNDFIEIFKFLQSQNNNDSLYLEDNISAILLYGEICYYKMNWIYLLNILAVVTLMTMTSFTYVCSPAWVVIASCY